jgi:hypothetical protein
MGLSWINQNWPLIFSSINVLYSKTKIRCLYCKYKFERKVGGLQISFKLGPILWLGGSFGKFNIKGILARKKNVK